MTSVFSFLSEFVLLLQPERQTRNTRSLNVKLKVVFLRTNVLCDHNDQAYLRFCLRKSGVFKHWRKMKNSLFWRNKNVFFDKNFIRNRLNKEKILRGTLVFTLCWCLTNLYLLSCNKETPTSHTKSFLFAFSLKTCMNHRRT